MRSGRIRGAITRSVLLPVFICAVVIHSESASYALTVNRILAHVDDEIITLTDYQRYMKGLGLPEDSGVINEEVLKKMIEEKVILHEAKRKGIVISEEEIDRTVDEVRKDTGLSPEEMESGLRKDDLDMTSYKRLLKEKLSAIRLVEAEVDSKVIVTDKDVEGFYKEHEKDYADGPERVVLKAIYLSMSEDSTVTEITDLKRKALKIAAQLEKGESFQALVDQYDDDQLKSQNGTWGEFERGALVPALDEKVFSMKPGETIGPLWLRDGVYILKLERKRGGGIRPFGEVAAQIRENLRRQEKERLFNEWMKALWEKASIKVN